MASWSDIEHITVTAICFTLVKRKITCRIFITCVIYLIFDLFNQRNTKTISLKNVTKRTSTNCKSRQIQCIPRMWFCRSLYSCWYTKRAWTWCKQGLAQYATCDINQMKRNQGIAGIIDNSLSCRRHLPKAPATLTLINWRNC